MPPPAPVVSAAAAAAAVSDLVLAAAACRLCCGRSAFSRRRCRNPLNTRPQRVASEPALPSRHAAGTHSEIAAAALACYGASATIIALPEAWLAGRIRVEAGEHHRQPGEPVRLRRFFLPKLLPGVRRVLYLDADVVVQADVASLFELSMPAGDLAAAVPPSEASLKVQVGRARAGERMRSSTRAAGAPRPDEADLQRRRDARISTRPPAALHRGRSVMA